MRSLRSQTTAAAAADHTDIDRFHLVMDVSDRVPPLGCRMAHLRQLMRDKRTKHWHYVREHGEDMPAVRDWTWAVSSSRK